MILLIIGANECGRLNVKNSTAYVEAGINIYSKKLKKFIDADKLIQNIFQSYESITKTPFLRGNIPN